MTITVTFILLLAGAICFFLAALGVNPPRIALVPLGLLFWILVALIAAA